MLQITEPVKFIGTSTKEGVSKRTGNDYSMTEATFFVPDLGRVSVLVDGKPKFPEVGQTVNVQLSIKQGSFQKLEVVYDENSRFVVSK